MRLLIAATILALTLAACGGDTNDSNGDSLESYFEGLESAYAELYEAFDSTGDLPDESRDQELVYLIRLFSEFRRELNDLDPPPGVSDAHARLVKPIAGIIDGMEVERANASRRDDAAFATAIARSDEWEAACGALVAIARANNIDTAIECGDKD